MAAPVDFHSHVLPGLDDGSASVEESIALLRMEAEQGITHVVATPHFYPAYDSPAEFLARRDRAEQQLRSAITGCDGLPELTVGAEVYYFRGISESEYLPQLTIRNKKCILIEMPPVPWPEAAYRELEDIWTRRGILPIIAHIDRYIAPLHTFGIPGRLARLPVLVQANAEFFLNKSTASMALKMLKADQIHLLGSDCHNTNDRLPNLGAAVQRIESKLGSRVLAAIHAYEHQTLGILPASERNGVKE